MSRFAPKQQAARAPSRFSFSYSKLKTYENCPKKYGHLYVLKDVQEPDSDHLRIGNEIHAALADAIASGKPMSKHREYEDWVARCRAGHDDPDVTLLVEQKLALTENFKPCVFFDKDAWFRGIVDFAKIVGDVALIVDWKTGKPNEDSIQLALFAALIFAHHPQVRKVRTEFVWLAHGFTTREDFTRDDMTELWSVLLPRVGSLENSHQTMEFPAVQSGLCRFCPVTQCLHKKG